MELAKSKVFPRKEKSIEFSSAVQEDSGYYSGPPSIVDVPRSLKLGGITGSLTRAARFALMFPAGLKLQLTIGG